jgi:hypothetical protein
MHETILELLDGFFMQFDVGRNLPKKNILNNFHFDLQNFNDFT